MDKTKSILDEDYGDPKLIFIKDDEKRDDYIIYLVSMILILAFYFWLTYSITSALLTDNLLNSTALNQCFPGQCPTDQITGEKICPENINQKYAYDITTQVCNYPGLCQGQLPYAINSDNSTNINGICQNDPANDGEPLDCRCSKNVTCPDYILSSFDTISGNPFSSNTNTEFSQNLISSYGGSGENIKKPNTGFCKVPLNWLFISTPGCVGISGDSDLDLAKQCMSLNPCLQGTLAFISDNSTLITNKTINSLGLGCVRSLYLDESTVCDFDKGYLPVYDILSNGIVCKLICDDGEEARYDGGIQENYDAPNNFGCYPACENIVYEQLTGKFVCQ